MQFPVNIDVDHLGRAIDFYCAAFEVHVVCRFGEHRHWTPVHLDIVVDDIATAVARALVAGARLERPVRSVCCLL